jgi:hypothetical protein
MELVTDEEEESLSWNGHRYELSFSLLVEEAYSIVELTNSRYFAAFKKTMAELRDVFIQETDLPEDERNGYLNAFFRYYASQTDYDDEEETEKKVVPLYDPAHETNMITLVIEATRTQVNPDVEKFFPNRSHTTFLDCVQLRQGQTIYNVIYVLALAHDEPEESLVAIPSVLVIAQACVALFDNRLYRIYDHHKKKSIPGFISHQIDALNEELAPGNDVFHKFVLRRVLGDKDTGATPTTDLSQKVYSFDHEGLKEPADLLRYANDMSERANTHASELIDS